MLDLRQMPLRYGSPPATDGHCRGCGALQHNARNCAEVSKNVLDYRPPDFLILSPLLFRIELDRLSLLLNLAMITPGELLHATWK